MVSVFRIKLYVQGLLIETSVLFHWGFAFPLFASLGIFKGISQSVICPYFTNFPVHNYSKGNTCTPGTYTLIFLMAPHFIIDHIEYVALRRDQYCLQVKCQGQSQDRQYFMYMYADISPLNFYLLSCFFSFSYCKDLK